MEQRRLRKHQAQKRALVVCRDYRRIFAAAPGGRTMLATITQAVSVQDARFAEQERCRIEQKAAADRGRKARRFLYVGLRHVAVVSRRVKREDGTVQAFEKPAWMSDEALLARAEAILSVASPHEERFVNAGLQPGFLAVLAGEIAALKQAKDGVTRARARFTESTAAFDRGLDAGDEAIAVLDGILRTSPDAPTGAITALRQAKRIGPRVTDVDESAKPVQERRAPAMRAGNLRAARFRLRTRSSSHSLKAPVATAHSGPWHSRLSMARCN